MFAIAAMVLGGLGGAVSIAAYLFPALRLFKVVSDPRVLLAIFALCAGVVFAGYFTHRGELKERARIERQNEDAIRRAQEGSANARTCASTGGLWDIATGKCFRFEGGNSNR